MKFLYFGLILINHYGRIFGKEEIVQEKLKLNKHDNVEYIRRDILASEWGVEDGECVRKMINMLDGVQNGTLWAAWMWDANPKPIGHLFGSRYQLGNYDECLKAPWTRARPDLRSQYCLVEVQLHREPVGGPPDTLDPYSSVEDYRKVISKHEQTFDTAAWGLCLPAECSSRFIATYAHILLENSHLAALVDRPAVEVESCQVAGQEYRYPTGFVLLCIIAVILIVLITSASFIATQDAIVANNSMIKEIATALSIQKNTKEMLTVSEGGLEVFYGIRFLTAVLVVLGHNLIFTNSVPVFNTPDYEKDIDSGFGTMMMHIDLLVDTFFFMSGCLLLNAFVTSVSRLDRPFSVVLKRYIRLLGCFSAVILYTTSVSYHVADGPVWHKFAKHEEQICADNWWLSLLMLNNYVNSLDICYIVTWYLPCDFHLYILAIIIFKIYLRSKRAGFLVYGVLMTVAIILPGWITYAHRLQPLLRFDPQTLSNLRHSAVFNNTYIRTHNRMAPFLVGMAVGYVVASYRPAPDMRHKYKAARFVGGVISLTIMFGTIASGHHFYGWQYNPLVAALYASFNRLVWTLALALLVGLSAYGGIPIITSFLTWSPFVPLSKLSYGIYLAHPAFIQRTIFSLRTPMTHSAYNLIVMSLGVGVCSCVASYIIYIFIEAPIINVADMALFRKRKTNDKDERTKLDNDGVQKKNDKCD